MRRLRQCRGWSWHNAAHEPDLAADQFSFSPSGRGVIRRVSVIRFQDRTEAAALIKPRPPIWYEQEHDHLPEGENTTPASTSVRPVTQVQEVA